jgi:uncharacterized Zn-finger protein
MSIKNSLFEVLHVNSKKVSCEGGSGASSHPLVYLNMGDKEHVSCPYCSKCFTIQKNIPNQNDKRK